MIWSTATTITVGLMAGSTTNRKVSQLVAPSILAAR